MNRTGSLRPFESPLKEDKALDGVESSEVFFPSLLSISLSLYGPVRTKVRTTRFDTVRSIRLRI